VLVDYRNLPDTIACLESLGRLAYPSVDVIVVDNASPESDDMTLRDRFGPAVTVIRSERNDGFGAGANQGVRVGLDRGAELIWLLNNDTIAPADSLTALVATLEASPGYGIVSPVVTGSEREGWSDEIWFAGGQVDLRRGVASHVLTLPGGPILETAFVSGCAMLVRREVLESVGLLEESYFLFWEDVEFCLRAARAGWKCGVVAASRVAHRVHGTIGDRSYETLAIRNSRDVSGRHGSARDVAGVALRSWLGIFQAMAGLIVGPDRRGSEGRLRGHVMGLGRLTGAVLGRLLRRSGSYPRWRPEVPAPTGASDR
jgi:GT2 family glycosyltransferase